MAKEKFVRSKPHVNFFDGLKQKLFGAPPQEPPIEPLDESETPEDLGDWGKATGLESSLEAVDYREGGPPEGQSFSPEKPAAEPIEGVGIGSFTELQGITTDVDPAGQRASDFAKWSSEGDPGLEGRIPAHTPDFSNPRPGDPGPAEAAMFNPKELTVDKSVPWQQAEDDAFKVETGQDGSSQVAFGDGAQGEVPQAGGQVESEYEYGGGDAGQTDARFMKSRSGHQMDADEDNEALGAEEGSIPGTQHDHVYQHNQTDLQFINEPAADGAAAAHQEGGQNNFVHQLPTRDEADSLTAAEPDDAGSFFLPETDDEVLVGFEQGGQNAPVILGSMWSGKDAPPTSEAGDTDELAVPESDAADAAGQPTFDPLTTFAFRLHIDADEPGDSTLVGEFKVSETLVPLDAGEAPDFPDLDVDDLDTDLDD